MIRLIHGRQEGDPVKAADALIKLAATNNPPLRLMLGTVAIASVNSKLESVLNDLQSCDEIARQVIFS
ncbi:MAG: hypothetical protein WKF87_20875 [Chryseolinea sp.]